MDTNSKQPSLLLVDDDLAFADLLKSFLGRNGYAVTSVANGEGALEAATRRGFDLFLLDVTMPGMDGFTVLQRLRRVTPAPVIMLTSRIASADRVQGLDQGADDYICKPFDPDELLSRVRAVLRRTRHAAGHPTRYRIGGHLFDLETLKLTKDEATVHLTSLERELLQMLLEGRGKVITREMITLTLQDRELDVFDRSLDVHISRLRSKLGFDGAAIQTVRGIGYSIAAFTGA